MISLGGAVVIKLGYYPSDYGYPMSFVKLQAHQKNCELKMVETVN